MSKTTEEKGKKPKIDELNPFNYIGGTESKSNSPKTSEESPKILEMEPKTVKPEYVIKPDFQVLAESLIEAKKPKLIDEDKSYESECGQKLNVAIISLNNISGKKILVNSCLENIKLMTELSNALSEGDELKKIKGSNQGNLKNLMDSLILERDTLSKGKVQIESNILQLNEVIKRVEETRKKTSSKAKQSDEETSDELKKHQGKMDDAKQDLKEQDQQLALVNSSILNIALVIKSLDSIVTSPGAYKQILEQEVYKLSNQQEFYSQTAKLQTEKAKLDLQKKSIEEEKNFQENEVNRFKISLEKAKAEEAKVQILFKECNLSEDKLTEWVKKYVTGTKQIKTLEEDKKLAEHIIKTIKEGIKKEEAIKINTNQPVQTNKPSRDWIKKDTKEDTGRLAINRKRLIEFFERVLVRIENIEQCQTMPRPEVLQLCTKMEEEAIRKELKAIKEKKPEEQEVNTNTPKKSLIQPSTPKRSLSRTSTKDDLFKISSDKEKKPEGQEINTNTPKKPLIQPRRTLSRSPTRDDLFNISSDKAEEIKPQKTKPAFKIPIKNYLANFTTKKSQDNIILSSRSSMSENEEKEFSVQADRILEKAASLHQGSSTPTSSSSSCTFSHEDPSYKAVQKTLTKYLYEAKQQEKVLSQAQENLLAEALSEKITLALP